MKFTEKILYRDRIEHLQSELAKKGLFAALIQKPRNLYFYVKTSQPSNLWVPAEGEPILFTRRVHELTSDQAVINNIKNASRLKEMKQYLEQLGISPGPNNYIGVESDFLPYNLIEKFKREFDIENVANITNLIMKQRLVKTDDEVKKIRNSVKVWEKSHEAILKYGKAGQ